MAALSLALPRAISAVALRRTKGARMRVSGSEWVVREWVCEAVWSGSLQQSGQQTTVSEQKKGVTNNTILTWRVISDRVGPTTWQNSRASTRPMVAAAAADSTPRVSSGCVV